MQNGKLHGHYNFPVHVCKITASHLNYINFHFLMNEAIFVAITCLLWLFNCLTCLNHNKREAS